MKTRQAFIAFVALWALAAPASAQVVPQPGPPFNIACAYNTTPVTLTDGQAGWIQCDSAGKLAITTTPATGSTQDVNVKTINGVTPLMGNGVTGTGSQRVTIASDNTAFSVNATLGAETTKVIGTVNQGTSPWVISGAVTNAGTFAVQNTPAAPAAQTYVGNVNTQGTKATYRWVTAAPAIDAAGVIFELQGSGTKTIRVTRIIVGGDLTVTSNGVVQVSRNSTATTGGTSVTVTGAKLDSASAAATAVAKRWTAVGTTGTQTDVVASRRTTWTADNLTNGAEATFTFGDVNGQAFVLRGTAEYMTIQTQSFGSYTGASYTLEVEATEE